MSTRLRSGFLKSVGGIKCLAARLPMGLRFRLELTPAFHPQRKSLTIQCRNSKHMVVSSGIPATPWMVGLISRPFLAISLF